MVTTTVITAYEVPATKVCHNQQTPRVKKTRLLDPLQISFFSVCPRNSSSVKNGSSTDVIESTNWRQKLDNNNIDVIRWRNGSGNATTLYFFVKQSSFNAIFDNYRQYLKNLCLKSVLFQLKIKFIFDQSYSLFDLIELRQKPSLGAQ